MPNRSVEGGSRVLLIDCCGDWPLVATAEGGDICAQRVLGERSASASLLTTIRELLEESGWTLSALRAVGVVAGPGSFTGVRTGLAAAKGLCEAAGLKLAAVSRLEVLLKAGVTPDAVAVLHAGRRQVYFGARQGTSNAPERLLSYEQMHIMAEGRELLVAEMSMLEVLAEARPRLVEIRAEMILAVVTEVLAVGGSDIASADANYVRSEGDIYRRERSAPGKVAESSG